ncbi:MAG: 16S rRNA (cytosine(1402)-N(4))-methyltransferase [Burkholderiales bacterium 70-64]|nr:MAG: 16S rRNA (cytosine(1402)-N(4))-methyltransferase [Burkholderiales bacterium 70-64]
MASDSERPADAQATGLGHRTVLLDEAIEALAVRPAGHYVDCTFGRGGHSAAILERLGPEGRLLAIDRDPAAVQAARDWRDARFTIVHARFSDLDAVLDAHGFGQVDGVLLDLGVSSPQLDDPARGFSFREDGPLDMRMDPGSGAPVRDWLLGASEDEIARVVKDYGEERLAVQIAKAIVARRREAGSAALRTTGELAALVAGVVRRRQGRAQVGKDPATRTFQALRIHVNQELEELALVLEKAVARLARGARLVVISFHSLEDRMVKQFMVREAGRDAPRDPVTGALRPESPPRLRVLQRVRPAAAARPARAGAGRPRPENPRARSALMRVAERI